jgi:ParB family chromosome partitioning protein
VPIVVRDVAPGEKSQLELALVENIQREDLNPIDEALAYKRLADQFQLTQEQIAAAVGKDPRDDRQPPASPAAAR